MNQIPQEPSELGAWWREAVGEDLAYWVQPVRLDAGRRLHVRCLTRAWSIQMKLLGQPVTARLNAAYPELAVAGLVASLRLLVLGPAHWPHHELLTASLESAWS
ncbi:DciA family protein [Streptomyces sp. NPDC045369]|uniref:DciA family protein n=1 Tax=Streptomyces sp. NPDC045369 TaxID=3155732 RepID=UPI0033C55704